MKLRAFFILFLFLSLVSFAQAQRTTTQDALQISPTIGLEWPKALGAQVNMLSSFHGFWLEGHDQGKPYSIWISRVVPSTYANSFSVDRYWKENLKFTESKQTPSTDLGCKEEKNHVFRCDRDTKSLSGHFLAEALVWNKKSDLVVVSVSSPNSNEEARTILQQISFLPSTEIAKRSP